MSQTRHAVKHFTINQHQLLQLQAAYYAEVDSTEYSDRTTAEKSVGNSLMDFNQTKAIGERYLWTTILWCTAICNNKPPN